MRKQTRRPSPKRGYRLLSHRSDVFVESWGPDLAGAFETAASGMLSVMTDLRRVRAEVAENISLSGQHDLKDLLYSWLEAVLLKFETDHMLLPRSKVSIGGRPGSFWLKARLRGEHVDTSRHVMKDDVKGITFHEMEISKTPRGYRTLFLLDL